MPAINLTPQQQYFVDKMLTHDRYAIFAKPGFGKTLTILEGLYQLKQQGKFTCALILAPRLCLRGVWAKEIEKWKHGFSYHIAHDAGLRAIPLGRDIYIASTDMVSSRFAKNLLVIANPDTLVVDESSKYRNPTTKRTRNLHAITFNKEGRGDKTLVTPRFLRTYIMTGTPRAKDIQNLWSQIYLLDGGKRLGRNITMFRNRYMAYDMYKRSFNPLPGADTEVYDKIKDLVSSITMPSSEEPRYNDVYCYFSDDETARYRQLKRKKILEIVKEEAPAITNISAVNAILRQMSGGAFYYNNEVVSFSEAKIIMLLELIEQQQGRPVLIGYYYNHEKDRIIEALPKSLRVAVINGGLNGRQAERVRASWNNRELDVLLGHPSAMGHGLDFQHGGSDIIWFTPPGMGDYELYTQFNSRLNRPGQTEQVVVTHLITADTYDEVSYSAIANKSKASQELFDYVQAEIDLGRSYETLMRAYTQKIITEVQRGA